MTRDVAWAELYIQRSSFSLISEATHAHHGFCCMQFGHCVLIHEGIATARCGCGQSPYYTVNLFYLACDKLGVVRGL